MSKIKILILALISTNSFAQNNGATGVFSGKDSTSPFSNVLCITSACTTTNTGNSITIGAGCDPNNVGMDSAPVTDHYECSWNGTNWTFGTNINAACGNGNCSPAYLEWADQTTTKKCDGTVRNQTNDFSRCSANGGETCTMTWSDGTTTSIPGNQAAADAGTNYVTAYASSSVAWGSVCSSEKRYCQETSPGSGVQFITGSYKYKNCVTNPPANCTSPWGTGVAHGTSVAAYQSASVNAPVTCISESRTCINGSLSGSFTNQNCVVNSGMTVEEMSCGGYFAFSSKSDNWNVFPDPDPTNPAVQNAFMSVYKKIISRPSWTTKFVITTDLSIKSPPALVSSSSSINSAKPPYFLNSMDSGSSIGSYGMTLSQAYCGSSCSGTWGPYLYAGWINVGGSNYQCEVLGVFDFN